MRDAGVLSRAVGRIYATLLDDDAERGWLDLVRDAVGAEHAILTDAGDDALAVHASRIDDGMLPLARQLSSTTMYDPALACMPARSVCRLSDYIPVRDLLRTDLYQQCIRPLCGGHGLVFTWSHARGRTAIAVCRDVTRSRDYAGHEVAALQPLLSHLHNAFELRTRMRRGQSALQWAHAALDAMREGVAVVDRDCRVQYVNAAAAALLRDGDGMRIDGQVLCASSRRDGQRLHRLVGDMLALHGAAAEAGAGQASPGWPRTGGMLAIARRAPKRPVLVSAMPADDAMRLSGTPEFPGAVVLVLRDSGDTRAPSVEILMEACGLTPRESQLARALCDGGALLHAARRLGISEGTARQYLKGVFAKTGVHRQSELVALLSGMG